MSFKISLVPDSECDDDEYSYDAYINGRWCGVFSTNAISVIQDKLTYNEFYAGLRKILPSREYPQTPQLEGSSANKNRLLFETDSLVPLPEPEPGPEPEPEKSWFSKYWWVLLIIVVIVFLIYWFTK